MKKESFNILIILFVTYFPFSFFKAFTNFKGTKSFVKKMLKRTRNGTFRFRKRLKTQWPMHIFFLLLLMPLLVANIILNNFVLENYLISYTSLLITVYFLDFLYSEQRRRETANKRYMIDWKIRNFIQSLEFGISDLLFYDIPDEDGKFSSSRIFDLNPVEIQKIIASDLFWETEINLKLTKGFDYWINKNDFLNEILDKIRDDINTTLTRYSDILLYEDFKDLYRLDEILHSFYLKEESDFTHMNQQFIAVMLNKLINSINQVEQITSKWHQ